MTTIPAQEIVQINPAVLSAGGGALDLTAIFLTTSTRVPTGTVKTFPNAASVLSYFGPGTEYNNALIYFNGYRNKTKTPGSLGFAQYPTAAVAGYLQGGPGLTLAEVQAITPGTLTITFAGTPITSASIDLSGATSLSNAATIIQAAFTTPPFAVTYDSVSGGFVFTSTATGVTETIVFPSDTIAMALLLTAATGAVLSQGANTAVPGTFMDNIVAQTQNWASFTTLFNPDSGTAIVEKLAFATWTSAQNNRYLYVPWETTAEPTTTVPATDSLGYAVKQASLSGISLNWENGDQGLHAFVCGVVASIDFARTNGRITAAFKSQDGLVAGVTTALAASNLLANGYNYYGAYATANSDWIFYNNGSVSGEFDWLDSYVNQIWLNNSFLVSLMDLLTTANSIPYNASGDALIAAALADDIAAAVNAGVIRAGVTLSSSQVAEVNEAAGVTIAPVLQSRGWYLQVLDAAPSVRQLRGSPPVNFWYVDGESVQMISMASILLQ